ncbi:MAG: hypothetical protein M1829_004888 [Trizodia sp. TS-e1964]|nr:MAG: hypothetical protein M1829_004888 [Trizodia sp. TS-e1964]
MDITSDSPDSQPEFHLTTDENSLGPIKPTEEISEPLTSQLRELDIDKDLNAEIDTTDPGQIFGSDEAMATKPHDPPPPPPKKKSKTKNRKPTGFEENYADAPMTPEEWEEEASNIYHPSRSFPERIELCIQRYKAKRKFDCDRKTIFDKYLSLGGIDTGPKAFSGGIDNKDLGFKNDEEIALLAATDFIGGDITGARPDIKGNRRWIVDFEAVAKGFFSSIIPANFALDEEQNIRTYTALIRNFLSYILHHEVCPEYADDVKAARAVCDLAQDELCKIGALSKILPGDFNIACSTLFGGYYKGLYNYNQDWVGEDELAGMDDKRAKLAVMAGLATVGEDSFYSAMNQAQLTVVESAQTCFEVTEIIPAKASTREFYTTLDDLQSLGVIKAKTWINPSAPPEDMTDSELENRTPEIAQHEFWVEEDILDHCFIGMKVDATVRKLSCGIEYFDSVRSVYCSFYTYLLNERFHSWIGDELQGAVQISLDKPLVPEPIDDAIPEL